MSIKYITILFIASLCLIGCSSDDSHPDVVSVTKGLDDYFESIGERSPDSPHSNTFFTSGGVFCISTQPGVVGEDGRLSLQGKSRVTGFFIAPRLIWVDTKIEAKRMIIEDMLEKKGYPTKMHTSTTTK
jgi:hypothetical protein